MGADTVGLYGGKYINGFEKNQSIERIWVDMN